MSAGKSSKVVYSTAIAAMLLLGVVHVAMTPVFYPGFSSFDSMWFAGTGLGVLFAGLVNYMNLRINRPFSFWCALAADILMSIWGIALCALDPGHVPSICVTAAALLLLICTIVQKPLTTNR